MALTEGATKLNGNHAASCQMKRRDDFADTSVGIGSFRPACLQRFATVNFMFLLLVLNTFTLTLEISFTFISITSIQKRYGLSSGFMGLTETITDAADILSVIFITYFGGRPNSHKPRWIASAFCLCAVSFFLKALTQFISDPYDYENFQVPESFLQIASPGVCAATGVNMTAYQTGSTDQCQSHLHVSSPMIPKGSEPVILILIAAVLQGVGRNAGYALGMPYIDDNVSKSKSPMYMGTLYALNVIGPIAGMPLSMHFIKRYVDFYRVDQSRLEISPRDPRWVGAWWMGYVAIGCPMLVFSLLMFLVPKRMPGRPSPEESLQGDKSTPDEEYTNVVDYRAQTVSRHTLKDLPSLVRRLVSNSTLMALLLGNTALAAHTGVAMFHAKYIEEQFRTTAAESGMYVVLQVFLPTFVGFLVCGYLLWRFKPSLKKMAMCLVILDVLVFVVPFLKMQLGCDNVQFAGVTVPYESFPSQPNHQGAVDLNSTCNSHCACPERYSPVCGLDDITYFSACHAGCKVRQPDKTYSECDCVRRPAHDQGNATLAKNEVTRGMCSNSCRNQLSLFLVLSGIFTSFLAMVIIIEVVLILRCVSPTDKPYAMGFRAVFTQVLGSMPSPLYTGLLIDSACSLWGKTACGQRGACLLYDLLDYRYKVMGLFAFLKGLSLFFYTAVLITLCRNPDPGNTGTKKAHVPTAMEKPDTQSVLLQSGHTEDDVTSV